MQLTFRAKLLAGQVALVAIVVGLVMVELDRSLASDLEEQLKQRLEAQAAGAAQWVKQNRHPEKLVSRLAAVVGARVAIFDERGSLIADSEPQSDPQTATEISAALDGAVGRAVRSDGRGESVAHVAVPTEDAIIRLSAPLASIDATIAGMRRRLGYASLLALLAAIGLGVLASRIAARPLRTMTRAADRIARGEYEVELPPRTPDEFGLLSGTLASLASQLRADMARIEQLERVRRDFIANVSHELRTPITTIQGYAETLLDTQPDAASRREFTEAIHRQAMRLGSLTSQLLRLSELEARAPEEEVQEPVDVGAIAEHVVSDAKSRADGVSIETSFQKDLVALGDPSSVEQILDNLIDNAIKHGGKLVRVEARRDRADIVVSVVDHGPGIAAEHLPRVFERFYRVDPSRSRALGGSGLGLAITKHLCEAMGGRIAVTSAGETRFEVRLPSAKTNPTR